MQSIDSIIDAVPAKFRTAYRRALAGKLSPRATIKVKCQECCGFEMVVERVGGCTTRICPLWALRPYRNRQQRAQTSEARVSGEDQRAD